MRLFSQKGIFDTGKVLFLSVDEIEENPDQPRTHFEQADLQELANSIASFGVLQPLTVRKLDSGWELVAGERRLRAARLAGLSTVPCLAISVDSQSSSLLALMENLQRRDLDFWEESQAIRRLIDTYHLSQEELARRLGKSQSAIANKLRILRLSEDTLALLRANSCTERHARALLALPTPEQQLHAAAQVVKQHLNVAQTEAFVASMLREVPKPPTKRPLYIIKDVRLFLNTISHSLDLMHNAGVDAECQRQDSEEEIMLTIRIPRAATKVRSIAQSS